MRSGVTLRCVPFNHCKQSTNILSNPMSIQKGTQLPASLLKVRVYILLFTAFAMVQPRAQPPHRCDPLSRMDRFENEFCSMIAGGFKKEIRPGQRVSSTMYVRR
jgi:hypothetical protein